MNIWQKVPTTPREVFEQNYKTTPEKAATAWNVFLSEWNARYVAVPCAIQHGVTPHHHYVERHRNQ